MLVLAACSDAEAPEEKSEPASAQATGPDAQQGISASDARLILPVVAGNPGAAYFRVTNGTTEAESLVSVYLEGASSAQLHETSEAGMGEVEAVEIPAGGSVEFAPGGKHVMAFDLGDELSAGGTSELTLIFADGDKVSLPISIEARGGAAN